MTLFLHNHPIPITAEMEEKGIEMPLMNVKVTGSGIGNGAIGNFELDLTMTFKNHDEAISYVQQWVTITGEYHVEITDLAGKKKDITEHRKLKVVKASGKPSA